MATVVNAEDLFSYKKQYDFQALRYSKTVEDQKLASAIILSGDFDAVEEAFDEALIFRHPNCTVKKHGLCKEFDKPAKVYIVDIVIAGADEYYIKFRFAGEVQTYVASIIAVEEIWNKIM